MSDTAKPEELSVRLHLLQAREGLTIQQMAERCSIPKSSLESYMRARNAKRPGVDALVAIADGMEVSIDWLVARSENPRDRRLEEKDYALACFNTTLALLQHLQTKQESDPSSPVISSEEIAGLEVHEAAAVAMTEFLGLVEMYRESTIFSPERHRLQEGLASTYAQRAGLPKTGETGN